MESQIWCHHSVVLCGGRLAEKTMLLPGLSSFTWEEAVSPLAYVTSLFPHMSLVPSQLLPLCWIPEGICISPKSVSGPLTGCNFFHCLNPHWFLQPEVTGTYLPGTGTLGWVVWSGAGVPRSWGMPPIFYPPHIDVGLPITVSASLCAIPCLSPHLSTSLPLLPFKMNVASFFKSLVVRFPHSSIFWQFWVIFVL